MTLDPKSPSSFSLPHSTPLPTHLNLHPQNPTKSPLSQHPNPKNLRSSEFQPRAPENHQNIIASLVKVKCFPAMIFLCTQTESHVAPCHVTRINCFCHIGRVTLAFSIFGKLLKHNLPMTSSRLTPSSTTSASMVLFPSFSNFMTK